VCQFQAFAILYNLGEAALLLLRKIAFGKYDWTQGNAIDILCRLAAEGVDRERTISELCRELPDMRYEAHLYALGLLLKQAANSNDKPDPIAATEVKNHRIGSQTVEIESNPL
jgi:hypothetical protein